MAVKRLTKDYYESVFNFYKKKRLKIVPKAQYNFWIESLEDLSKNNKSYFYNKYEIFVNGQFSETETIVKPFCSAILKRCKNYSAEVKSIIVEDSGNGKSENELHDLVKIIEAYCAETGIKHLDFYTNTLNRTANYFFNENKKYHLLFNRQMDSKSNLEYVFRRNILIDYFGDTTNWRDMCIWFLESTYLPYHSQKDFPTCLVINNNNSVDSFLDLPEFQSGCFEDDQYFTVSYSIKNKNVFDRLSQLTEINFQAYVFNKNCQKTFIEETMLNNDKADIILIFTLSSMYFEKNKKVRNFTWQDIIDQIKFVHRHYE